MTLALSKYIVIHSAVMSYIPCACSSVPPVWSTCKQQIQYLLPASEHICNHAGYDMDELYMFDLNSLTWEHILPKGSKPAARYLHTAVVIKDAMVIFGGSDAALGDVWSFNFDSRRWTQLSKVQPVSLTTSLNWTCSCMWNHISSEISQISQHTRWHRGQACVDCSWQY